MKATEATLSQLHSSVANVLLNNLTNENDEPYPIIISQAIKFLKDNDITCSITDNQDMAVLNDALKEKRAKRKLRIVGEDE